jgi:hypothetical protein
MALNAAHEANFEELDANVKLLALRVKASDGAARDQALEDLTDTHERALQLRVYHNNTLTAELEEANAALHTARASLRRHRQATRGVALLAGLAALYAAASALPATAQLIASWLSTTPVAVAVTAAVTYTAARTE